MTRINVFKTSAFLSLVFIIFGVVFTIMGIMLLIKAMIKGFNTQFLAGDWNSVLFILQGLLFFIMGFRNLWVRRYFIEWNDEEILFFLPDTKKIETIQFGEIINVTIRLFEIELKLKNKTRTLDLSNMQFENLKKIKEKFEYLKLKTW